MEHETSIYHFRAIIDDPSLMRKESKTSSIWRKEINIRFMYAVEIDKTVLNFAYFMVGLSV